MPRVSPRLVQHAFQKNPLLALLLRECRDLRSAQNELRWLTEHANTVHFNQATTNIIKPAHQPPQQTLLTNVHRRSQGEPLQYILGSQPFGHLDILCRKGVLIPRPETETYTCNVAKHAISILNQKVRSDAEKPSLRILDLCTGTGCIPLLLYSLIHRHLQSLTSPGDLCIEYLGLDISPTAIQLARDNLDQNVAEGHLHSSARDQVSFQQGDVFALSSQAASSLPSSPPSFNSSFSTVPTPPNLILQSNWDILISNPPYISPSSYAPGGSTSRSVRNYEPKLALVPELPLSPVLSPSLLDDTEVQEADIFYPHLIQISHLIRPSLTVLEVGDNEQAERVVEILQVNHEIDCPHIEVWRDDGSVDEQPYRPAADEGEKSRWYSVSDPGKASARAVVLSW